jgi:hypothetical protein
MAITKPLDKIHLEALRWFPSDEFVIDVARDMRSFGLMLRVRNKLVIGPPVPQWSCEQLIDDSFENLVILSALFERMAIDMHGKMAASGLGALHWPLTPGAKQLLQLMGLEMRGRVCPPLGKVSDTVLYVVFPDKWAEWVAWDCVDAPLEWWQSFVRRITSKDRG